MKPYRSQLPTPPQFLARHIIIKLIKAGVDPDTLDIQEIDPLNPFSSPGGILSSPGEEEHRRPVHARGDSGQEELGGALGGIQEAHRVEAGAEKEEGYEEGLFEDGGLVAIEIANIPIIPGEEERDRPAIVFISEDATPMEAREIRRALERLGVKYEKGILPCG